MSINMRRWAAMAAGTAVAAAAVTTAVSVLPAAAEEAADEPTSLVENFEYPGGSAEPEIRLIKGDGHILKVGCDQGVTSLEVYSFVAATPFCFEFRGSTGFLSLELEEAYGVRNYKGFEVDAKVSIEGATPKAVTVPADDWVGVGTGAGEGQAVLLELRF